MSYDLNVDITKAVCPVTFVKVKMALSKLSAGQTLFITLNDGEPIQNVPRSLKDEGHKVVKTVNNGDGTFGLVVVKDGLKQ
jgi:Predicted redox protein, regulator of disulfide bond formation